MLNTITTQNKYQHNPYKVSTVYYHERLISWKDMLNSVNETLYKAKSEDMREYKKNTAQSKWNGRHDI